jgi:FOG: HPt domain
MTILRIDYKEAIGRIEDEGIYKEIACAFAEHIPTYIAQLEAALMHNDAELATRTAHSIKSNCATVGCETLRLAFCQMEKLGQQQNINASLVLLEELRPQILQLREQLLEITASLEG